MRIATWNVNSLKARQEKVEWWLDRAAPDVLLMQETKLADDDAPVMAFAMAGYDLVHHGEGRWNGVAIAVRQGIGVDDVVTNFGDGPVRDSGPGSRDGLSRGGLRPVRRGADGAAPSSTRRGDGGPIRVVSLYAPNGRVVGSPFYEGKLRWFERLRRWLRRDCRPDRRPASSAATSTSPRPTPTSGIAAAVHGGTHVSEPERAAFRALLRLGPGRRLSRAATTEPGPLHLVGLPGRQLPQELRHADRPPAGRPRRSPARVVWAEIDREARKGPPIPSDHAPLVIDLDDARPPVRRRLGRRPVADRGPSRRPDATAASSRLRAEYAPRRTCPGHRDGAEVALDRDARAVPSSRGLRDGQSAPPRAVP